MAQQQWRFFLGARRRPKLRWDLYGDAEVAIAVFIGPSGEPEVGVKTGLPWWKRDREREFLL